MSIVLDGSGGISSTGGIDAADLTGTLPALDGAALTALTSANLTGALPAIDGSGLTGIVSVPSGTVIYHAASTAPTGFIKANGAALSRTTYADLFAAIGTVFGAGDGSTTFLIPDLRGEFMRGWDDSRGIDASRVFGSAQAEEIGEHDHGVDAGSFLYMNGSSGAGRAYGGGAANFFTTWLDYASNETRPRNIALLACIKH